MRDETETAEDPLADTDVSDPDSLAAIVAADNELFDAANLRRVRRGLVAFGSPDDVVPQLRADLDDMAARAHTVDELDAATLAQRREDAIAHLAERGGHARGQTGAPVTHGRRADIVLGPPAAGKSSALVDPLARSHGSMVIDADEAKQLLPEFDGGRGANAVHAESGLIADELLDRAMDAGRNIVHPRVGKTREGIEDLMSGLRESGYEVHVHMVDLPPARTMQRMLLRYVSTGRLIPPDYVASIGDLPGRTFDGIKEQAQGYTRVDNDVGPGESPRLVEQGGAATANPDVYGGSRSGHRAFAAPDARAPEAEAPRLDDPENLDVADMEVAVAERIDEEGNTVAQTRTVREIFDDADADERFADEVEACAQ